MRQEAARAAGPRDATGDARAAAAEQVVGVASGQRRVDAHGERVGLGRVDAIPQVADDVADSAGFAFPRDRSLRELDHVEQRDAARRVLDALYVKRRRAASVGNQRRRRVDVEEMRVGGNGRWPRRQRVDRSEDLRADLSFHLDVDDGARRRRRRADR